MVFSFHQTKTIFSQSNQKVNQRLLFTIGCKKERRGFSKFLKTVQFTIPNIQIDLTTFPKIKNYTAYNTCLTTETLRTEVTELVTKLNKDNYFIVAEVSLVS